MFGNVQANSVLFGRHTQRRDEIQNFEDKKRHPKRPGETRQDSGRLDHDLAHASRFTQTRPGNKQPNGNRSPGPTHAVDGDRADHIIEF